MLSNKKNPFRLVDVDQYYLSTFSGNDQVVVFDELAAARSRRNRNIKHLRRVQRTNFIGRAAIRIVDLFTRKEIAC